MPPSTMGPSDDAVSGASGLERLRTRVVVAATSPVTTVKLLAFVVALPTLILSLLVIIVGALRRRWQGAAGVV